MLHSLIQSLPCPPFINETRYFDSQNSILTLLSCLRLLLCLRLSKEQAVINVFSIAFQSYPLVLVTRLIFPRSLIHYDLGYLVADIPYLSHWRRFTIRILESFSLRLADLISLESKAQIQRSFFSDPHINEKLFNLYVGCPNLNLTHRTLPILNFPPESCNDKKCYFLFRGKLNAECGILYALNAFIRTLNVFSEVPLFVIQGSGSQSEAVRSFINDNLLSHHVILIERYVTEEEICYLQKNALFSIGQLDVSFDRLRYTLPHKFFEAMALNSLYLTIPSPALFEFLDYCVFGNNVYEKSSTLDPDDLSFISKFAQATSEIIGSNLTFAKPKDNRFIDMIFADNLATLRKKFLSFTK